MPVKYSICLVTHDRWFLYNRTILGNLACFGDIPREDYEVLVWDNNSNVETVEWLKMRESQFDKLILSPENVWKHGLDELVKMAKGKFVLHFDDDMIIKIPSWCRMSDALVEFEKRYPNLWGICSVIYELPHLWREKEMWDEKNALDRFSNESLPWEVSGGIRDGEKCQSFPGIFQITNGFGGAFWCCFREKTNFEFQSLVQGVDDAFANEIISLNRLKVGRFQPAIGLPFHLGRSTRPLYDVDERIALARKLLAERTGAR